ncbi:Hypothetical predicted protein [Cloeon dipterum]|uniref:Lipid-binding serum glycoprotein N-terminal domain-containing protein n=1 Tax=Cloeon dipterum TaxID=197152 RepID=A0A8S1D8U9_9INSE|nr:Hypothetical predicted protein [Cloeon dipterum]
MASARTVALLLSLFHLGTCLSFNVTTCDSGCVRARREAEAAGEKDIASQLRSIVEHYKNEDPVGLPGAPIPDPVDVPDFKFKVLTVTLECKRVKCYGLSKFRFQRIKLDLTALQAEVGVKIAALVMTGDYTTKGFLANNQGPFTVTVKGAQVEGVASLEVDRQGHLEAQNIDLNMKFDSINMNFENLRGPVFYAQGILNMISNMVFESVKPYIFSAMKEKILAAINQNIGKLPQTFPNSVPPLDIAIAEVRREIRLRGLDPYIVQNQSLDYGGAALAVTHLQLTGLASFYRVGDVSIEVVNHTANATLQVATQRLKGECNWQASLGWLSRTGRAEFWIDYLQVRARLLQPLNVQRRPRIERLQMTVGNLQTRVQGSGTLDYVAEFVLNVLPNVIRYQLVSLAEEPLRQKIQDYLDKVDVEDLILQQIAEMEKEQLEQNQTESVPPEKSEPNDKIEYDD